MFEKQISHRMKNNLSLSPDAPNSPRPSDAVACQLELTLNHHAGLPAPPARAPQRTRQLVVHPDAPVCGPRGRLRQSTRRRGSATPDRCRMKQTRNLHLERIFMSRRSAPFCSMLLQNAPSLSDLNSNPKGL
jgi:hypothetical protein